MDNLSYALFADGNLSLSLHSEKKNILKRLFKSTLLFEDKLLLSDAQVIGNKNFRELLSEDEDFKNLFDESTLTIGIRDEADFRIIGRRHTKEIISLPDITNVLSTFADWDKCHWGDSKEIKAAYENPEGLEEIYRLVSKERYNTKEVNIRYSDEVTNIFATDLIKSRLGDPLADAIRELVIEKRAAHEIAGYNEKGGLGLVFFQKELELLLKKRGITGWDEHKESIFDCVYAPYLTSLPKQLQSNPYYTKDHQRRLELIRGNPIVTKEIEKEFNYESRLMRYNEGLELLTSLDIRMLRDSSQYREYRKAIKEREISDAAEALIEYLNKIDNVILKKHPYLKEYKKSPRDKIVTLIQESGNRWGFGLSLLTDATNFLFKINIGLPFPLNSAFGAMSTFFIDGQIEKLGKKIKKKEDKIKTKLADQMREDAQHANPGEEPIDFDRFSNEVLVNVG